MRLWLEVNKVTKKKNWKSDKCNDCEHRFSCFSGNEIILDPDTFLEENNHWLAKFSVPRCLRVGIFKQFPDNWFMSNFKHGKILDTGYDVSQVTVTIKPPSIRLEGRVY